MMSRLTPMGATESLTSLFRGVGIFRFQLSGFAISDRSRAMEIVRVIGQSHDFTANVVGVAVWGLDPASPTTQWVDVILLQTQAWQIMQPWGSDAASISKEANKRLASVAANAVITSGSLLQLTAPESAKDFWSKQADLWRYKDSSPGGRGGPTEAWALVRGGAGAEMAVVFGKADDGANVRPFPTAASAPNKKDPANKEVKSPEEQQSDLLLWGGIAVAVLLGWRAAAAQRATASVGRAASESW